MPLQLKTPIPVDADEPLVKRLPSLVTNFSVELDKPLLKISEVFPDHPGDHLQIIVVLPGKRMLLHLCMQFKLPRSTRFDLIFSVLSSECRSSTPQREDNRSDGKLKLRMKLKIRVSE